jgi:Tol biopolymer transport system component
MPPTLPSGTRLAFEREGNIFVATYPNLRGAVKVGMGQDPDISPDGRHVTFEESAKGDTRSFCIRDAATGRLIKRHAGTMPHFSPDGKYIAFSLFSGSRWTLWISDTGLTAPRKITGSGKDDPAFPSGWTANGLLVAYSEQIGGSIYALRPNGSIARKESMAQIAGKLDTSIPFGCAWSGDLSRIAFEAQTSEELVDSGQPLYGIYLYDFATKKRRLLTPKGMTGGNPVWQSRNLLLFTSGRNTKRFTPAQITAMEVNTGVMGPLISNATSPAVARRGA